LAAMGGLLAYLDLTGRGLPPFLRPPERRLAGDRMEIDPATRESLELVRSSSGDRAGSLLAAIDRTITGAGARLLAADLAAPLTDPAQINARLDLVELFHRDAGLRDGLVRALKSLPDIGRALGRLAARRGGPRDLAQ